jgi:integrating conjugative element relaxase (TIGR03760 family)
MFENKPQADANNRDSAGNQNQLIPVKQAAQLYAFPHRKKYIEPFQELLSIETAMFNEYCKPVLRNVSEYFQDLPYSREGVHSLPGGLLNFALERTYHALSMSRSYFLPTGSELVALTLPQQLWAYAVFTASLLQDVGHASIQFKVEMYDKDKKPKGEWHPFIGAMTKQGEYYQFDYLEEKALEVKRQTTVLLAKHFMPSKGFEWLASNPQVFDIWLALLQGDDVRSGTFGPTLLRAEAMVIKHFLADMQNTNLAAEIGKGRMKDLFGKAGSFKNIASKNKLDSINRAVQEFLAWLKDSVIKEKMKIGDDSLKVAEGGLLLTDELFEKYAAETGQDADKVRKAVTSYGITKPVGPTAMQSYIQVKSGAQFKGVILNNLFLTVPASMTALVLKWLPALQNSHIKVPGAISNKGFVKFISPDGQLVTKTQNDVQKNSVLTDKKSPTSGNLKG